MLIRPLHKIQVLESKKRYKSDSTGYFISQKQVGTYNTWEAVILFTRFGKSGKPRLELTKVMFDMVDRNTISKSGLDILSVVGGPEGIVSPFDSDITKIEPIMTDHKDLLDAPLDEFVAYIIAHSILLYKLECAIRAGPEIIITGPITSNAGINVPLVDQASNVVGHRILKGLARDVTKKTTDYRAVVIDYFSNTDNRIRCIESMRYHFAEAQNVYKRHMMDIMIRLENMDRKINNIVSYYEKHTEELKNLKANWSRNPWAVNNTVYVRIEDRGKKKDESIKFSIEGTKTITTRISVSDDGWQYVPPDR